MIISGALDPVHSAEAGSSQLMTHMNRIVQQALKQGRAEAESDDGLELGVLYLPPEPDHMLYTGARFPLFISNDDGIVDVLKGDKPASGYRGIANNQTFTTQIVPIESGSDYMTSDGLIDQVGGERRPIFGKNRLKPRRCIAYRIQTTLTACLSAWAWANRSRMRQRRQQQLAHAVNSKGMLVAPARPNGAPQRNKGVFALTRDTNETVFTLETT